MPDIKDVYNVVSKSNLFVDENDFRNQIASNPKEVFDFISKNKNTQGLFLDYNDFQDNLKKKRWWSRICPYTIKITIQRRS